MLQVWPLLPSECCQWCPRCKPGTPLKGEHASPQVLSMMPPEWFVLLFLIVLWRPSLPHTSLSLKQRAIVAQVWPPLPSEHAKSVLASTQWNKEQSLLMASASEWACKPGTCPQVLSMMPPEWFVLWFLIDFWRPSLPHTMKQRAIVAQVWPLLPSEHAKSVLASTQWNKEQSLLKYGLRFRVSMQTRHSSSGAVNDASGMIRTIIPHSLLKAILASHNETKSNRCSSMAFASEWVCKPGTHPQVLSMMPPEWFVLLFLIVLWRPSLPHTMKQRAIVAQVWPPLPSECASQALILRCCQWCPRNDLYYYSS